MLTARPSIVSCESALVTALNLWGKSWLQKLCFGICGQSKEVVVIQTDCRSQVSNGKSKVAPVTEKPPGSEEWQGPRWLGADCWPSDFDMMLKVGYETDQDVRSKD